VIWTGLLLFALAAVCAAGEDTGQTTDVFLDRQQAVMLVSQSVFLDRGKVDNIALFERLERAMGRKALDQYFPIANGTAFAISPDGYLVTAFHVIKHVPQDQVQRWSLRSFAHYVGKQLTPGYLEVREINKVFQEYQRIAKKSELYVHIRTADGKEHRAEVIAKNDELDLALLKINPGQELAAIPAAGGGTLRANQKVVTIGYPLQSVLDEFLDDLKSSITDGIVSAIRQDKWDIQHTAPINPGNSGGPLLNAEGALVGINVGEIREADNVCFAVGVQKLIEWLKSIDKGQILKEQP
jgi:S1-C subfamily serine protease